MASPKGCRGRRCASPPCAGAAFSDGSSRRASDAPALAIVHGWGGNAELMLPLAAPLPGGLRAAVLRRPLPWPQRRRQLCVAAALRRGSRRRRRPAAWAAGEVVAGGSACWATRWGTRRRAAGVRRATTWRRCQPGRLAHPAAMMRRWLAGKGFVFSVGAYILWYVQRVIGHRFDDIAPLPHDRPGALPGAHRPRAATMGWCRSPMPNRSTPAAGAARAVCC